MGVEGCAEVAQFSNVQLTVAAQIAAADTAVLVQCIANSSYLDCYSATRKVGCGVNRPKYHIPAVWDLVANMMSGVMQ